MTKTINIIIADDHQIVLDGLTSILSKESDIHILAEAGNGKQVLQFLKSKKPDVIVLDLSMPIMDGLTATEEIKKDYPDIPILILTFSDETEDIFKVIKAGASGYILKEKGQTELVKAIRVLAKDDTYYSQEVMKKYLDWLGSGGKSTNDSNLTPREKDILALIGKGKLLMRLEKFFSLVIRP